MIENLIFSFFTGLIWLVIGCCGVLLIIIAATELVVFLGVLVFIIVVTGLGYFINS